MALESTLTGKARDAVRVRCPGVKYYKHNDRGTEGMPDSTFTWAGCTSWVEFKHLDPSEPLHARPRSTSGLKKLQLMELLALERASGGRAWVVAYRKGKRGQGERVEIYRPSALYRVTSGAPQLVEPALTFGEHLSDGAISVIDLEQRLERNGCVAYAGYNHLALAELIRRTHGGY